MNGKERLTGLSHDRRPSPRNRIRIPLLPLLLLPLRSTFPPFSPVPMLSLHSHRNPLPRASQQLCPEFRTEKEPVLEIGGTPRPRDNVVREELLQGGATFGRERVAVQDGSVEE